MAASWSTLLPDTSSAREPIREAVDRVTELRGQVPAGCEAVSEAKAALERVQRDSQAEMATAIRQGDPAEPDTAAIEAARVQVDRAEGQLAALGQAIELEEAELGRVIAESRTKWLESVKRTEAAHRKSGLAALRKLQEAVEGLRSTAIAELWLKPGGLADRERRAPSPGLGHLPGSRVLMANGDDVAVSAAVAWFHELFAPSEPSLPAAERRPLAPIPSGVYPGPR